MLFHCSKEDRIWFYHKGTNFFEVSQHKNIWAMCSIVDIRLHLYDNCGMVTKRNLKIIIPSLIIVVVLAIYLLKTTAEKNFAEGNNLLYVSKYQEALSSYEKAGIMWPFIKSNPEYQKNLRDTHTIINRIKNSPAVTIFLKEKATEEEIQELANEIKAMKGIREVKVITKDDAYEIYKKQNKNDPALMDLVTKDILPVSIEVYTEELPTKEFQNNLVSFAKKKAFVDQTVISNKNL